MFPEEPSGDGTRSQARFGSPRKGNPTLGDADAAHGGPPGTAVSYLSQWPVSSWTTVLPTR